jgi:hypothetical protein
MADFVAHQPRGLIPEAGFGRDHQSLDTPRLSWPNRVGGAELMPERRASLIKNRSCRDRALVPTTRAFVDAGPGVKVVSFVVTYRRWSRWASELR